MVVTWHQAKLLLTLFLSCRGTKINVTVNNVTVVITDFPEIKSRLVLKFLFSFLRHFVAYCFIIVVYEDFIFYRLIGIKNVI